MKKDRKSSDKLPSLQITKATVRKKSIGIIINVIICFILLEFVFVFLYPFISTVVNSLKYDFELKDSAHQWVITSFNFRNYVNAYKHLNYINALSSTLLTVILSTAAHILSCSFIAYGFARFKFKGNRILFGLVILTIIIPPQTLMMPLYLEYAKIGWLKSVWPIIAPCFFGFGLKGGLYIFWFRQAIKGLPLSYEEAAKLEGCSTLRIFFRIIFPMLKGPIVVTSILSVIWHWNDFYEPSVYLTGAKQILTQKLANLNNYYATQVTGTGIKVSPVQMAACILVILPLLIMYFVMQRSFIKSVDLTGLANQ